MSKTTYDTVVIGGGVSGLTCALLQARKGRRVVLVEKAPHLSPTLWGFERFGTYFDTGFHYAGSVGQDGLLSHLVHRLGLDQQLPADIRPEVYDRIRFQGAGYDVPFHQGWDALEAGLADVYPSDRKGIHEFLGTVRSLWEEGRAAFKQDLGRSLGPLFSKEGKSLREALTQVTENPYLQAVLGSHAILYGSPAEATSLMFHSLVVGSYYESACVYRGGGRRWVEVLHNAVAEAGVEVRCGQGVTQILQDADGRSGGVVLADGSRLEATDCISTVHPKTLLTLLPGDVFRPAYRRRIDDLQESASAFVLFGRTPASSLTGNLILIDEPETMWDWQSRPFEERPLFVSAAADKSPQGVSIICPATLADLGDLQEAGTVPRSAGYKAWKQEVAERLLARLETHASDVVKGFALLETASPLTFRDWTGSPAGGIYGVQHRQEDMPLAPQTRVPGLYLSGQAIVSPGALGALCAGFLTESCVS